MNQINLIQKGITASNRNLMLFFLVDILITASLWRELAMADRKSRLNPRMKLEEVWEPYSRNPNFQNLPKRPINPDD